MPNVLSKITAALLAVVLLFVVPAVHAAQRDEDIGILSAYNTVVQFVDAVRNKGYLSSGMYSDFTQQLEQFGMVYDIEMEHQHKVYHPEYTDAADARSFQNQYSIHYSTYYTEDIVQTLYPDVVDTGVQEDNPKYELEIGDYFNVKVIRKSTSIYEIINSFIIGSSNHEPKFLQYGGMILNEDD